MKAAVKVGEGKQAVTGNRNSHGPHTKDDAEPDLLPDMHLQVPKYRHGQNNDCRVGQEVPNGRVALKC